MILVLLPAYNEAEALPLLLPKIIQVLGESGREYRILVCDDGSGDRTPELLETYATEMPLEVITHKYNRGLGETSRDLFERAIEICGPDDVIVRMDCDDTHEPEFIPKLVEKLDDGFDVVIASRFQPGGGQVGVGPYRAFISRCANVFMKVFFPVAGLKEYSCGFRAYRAGTIIKSIEHFGNNFIQLKGFGFTCTLEKLVKLKLIGARFGEVAFVLRYDQKHSASKMVSSMTMLGYLLLVICYHWPWGGWRGLWRDHLKRLEAEPGGSGD